MKHLVPRRLVRSLLIISLALVPSLIPAQDQPAKPARRVPTHFGQVGLSASQREHIYQIRARHHERIQALKQEIARLETEEMTECEAVLTAPQRRLLAQYRTTARARASARKAAASSKTQPTSP